MGFSALESFCSTEFASLPSERLLVETEFAKSCVSGSSSPLQSCCLGSSPVPTEARCFPDEYFSRLERVGLSGFCSCRALYLVFAADW